MSSRNRGSSGVVVSGALRPADWSRAAVTNGMCAMGVQQGAWQAATSAAAAATSARGEDVELVALWVGEACPRHVVALADVDVGGAERP
jgi:hypothetical protein